MDVEPLRSLKSRAARGPSWPQPWTPIVKPSKEIFMGDIQGSTRMCAVWHYTFIIEPMSNFDQQPVHMILNAINQRLKFASEPTIHQATEQRIVIYFFSRHKDVVQAFRLWDRTSTLYINGVPYLTWTLQKSACQEWWLITGLWWSEMLPGPGGIVCVLCSALWITCLFRKCVASNVLYFPVYLFSSSVHWIVEHLCTKRAVV